MKSQEQRIKDAAGVLRKRTRLPVPIAAERIAREILEAADSEPPMWPTDGSVLALWNLCVPNATPSELREPLRTAMLHDPIIKAALVLRDAYLLNDFDGALARVFVAIKEAGL